MHIQRQNEAFAYRLAMPAPAPEGLTFHYWPEDDPRIEKVTPAMRHLMKFPAVEAKVNGQHAGFISWDAHPRWDGEISMIQVPKEFQHHSIATSLFDHARTINPKLHHSPIKTEEGEGWARHEERRHTPAGQYRDLKNPKIPIKRKRLNANTIRCAADLVKKYTDQLYKEFHDWLDTERGGEWPVGTTRPTDYTQPMGGPLTYWDNIEEFMKDRYPAAYRGYSYGQEQAACALDGYGMTFPVYPRQSRTIPYETGPEAVSKYGYDPKQVAAGFMYLHSKAHNTARPDSRLKRLPRDIDRLSDIFQKRVDMQENYKQRKLLNANTIRCAADLTKKFIDQLQNEFTTWHQSQPNPDDWPLYRGVGGWENVEKFLHEKYPACYRGFDYCLEQARPLMHDKGFVDNGKYQQPPHYETGPEAEAKYGYDPKAVAAGMILLHNKENDWHGDRGSRIDVDTRLLNDIFQKRVMMQHEYEQRKLVNANTIRCADSPMMGININDSYQDYTGQILRGEKTIETRDTHSLKPYLRWSLRDRRRGCRGRTSTTSKIVHLQSLR